MTNTKTSSTLITFMMPYIAQREIESPCHQAFPQYPKTNLNHRYNPQTQKQIGITATSSRQQLESSSHTHEFEMRNAREDQC